VDGEGAARAMKRALADAGMAPSEVGYINAHGTSTPAGDPIEVTAVKSVFADHARSLWMGSTKSMTGHLLGAAGGLEAVVCALVLQRGIVPPTINLETPDPKRYRSGSNTAQREIKAVMSNSFGFGGHNVSLARGRVVRARSGGAATPPHAARGAGAAALVLGWFARCSRPGASGRARTQRARPGPGGVRRQYPSVPDLSLLKLAPTHRSY
jgi:hypothetical protein